MDSASGRRLTLSFSSSMVWKARAGQDLEAREERPRRCLLPYLDGGGGHLPGLVEVQRDHVREAAGVAVGGGAAVSEGLQDGVDRLPLLGCVGEKAAGVRTAAPPRAPTARLDSPEKILPVLPAMETRYWTRCWQLVVLPLPDFPSSTTD